MSYDCESGSPRFRLIVCALVVCQLGLHANMHGMRVAVPLQALSLGFTAMTVGILVAMFAIIPAMLAIVFGRFTDRAGFHKPIVIAAVLSITAGFSLALSDSLWVLCFGSACSGAGSGFGMIAIQRTASKLASTPADRIKIFSWVALAPAMAGLVGPALSGILIDSKGYQAAFAAMGCLPAMTLLLSRLVPSESSARPKGPQSETRRTRDLLQSPQLRRLLVINWLVAASWDAHGFVIPILGHERGFSASAIGGIFAAFGLASIVIRVLIPFFTNHLSPRILMVGGVTLAAISFGIYPLLEESWAMSLCAFAFGLALGSIQPTILATLHDVTPADRHGEALAIRSTMSQISMTTMPLLFGVIGASLGASVLLWLMAVGLGFGSWQSHRFFALGYHVDNR